MKLFFDTETTGVVNYKEGLLHESQPRICQLGAMLTDDLGGVKAEINLLIKPNGWTIPDGARAVHGISTEDCEEFGVDIRTALGMFNTFVKKGALLVAHNFDFDKFLINREVALLDKPPILEQSQTFCTMKNSMNILKIPSPRKGQFKWPKLQETYEFFFKRNFEGAHDAMADVRACGSCYWEILKWNAQHETQEVPK